MKLTQRIVVISFSWFVLWWATPNAPAQSSSQPPMPIPAPATVPPKNWGEPLNTTGAKLTCAKITRETVEGRPVMSYFFQATGVPKDKTYVLWTKWIDGHTSATSHAIKITDAGDVVVPMKSKEGEPPKPDTPFRFSWSQMFLGEPIEHALVSSDNTIQAFVKIIPFPLETVGFGGCRVALELVDSPGHFFVLHLEGFQPNEEVTTISKSGSEVVEGKVKLSKEGKQVSGVVHLVSPAVVGKKGGAASYTVKGKECEVILQYRWGNVMKQP